jgi:predicted nucleic acid-binding protein
MTEKVFVDSNVLVYAHDTDSGNKQRIAANAVAEIMDARSGVLSIQVLQEFYNTVTRKMRSAIARDVARELLRGYSSWTIQPLTPDDVVAASFLEQRHQLSFWDALIVQAALLVEQSSCFPRISNTANPSVESQWRTPSSSDVAV